MIRQLMRSKRRYIIIDVGTQRDFFLAEGKACIRNHRRVLTNIRRFMAWARKKDIPIISTCQVNPDNNGYSENDFCVDGTEGQKKISYTLISNRISFPADGHTDFPRNILRQHRQIILHKRCKDPFEEPRIERLLSEVQASEFIVIGAPLEYAVKAAALGLLQRGKKVTIIDDAVGYHNKSEAHLALRKIKAKGARVIETKKLAGISHLRYIGVCDCKTCQGLTRKISVGLRA